MLVLRSPDEVSRITDRDIRKLVGLRFAQVTAGEPYDPERHGYMIVVEVGDSIEAIEKESGLPLLTSFLGDARFGDPDFAPAAEVIEEHRSCYELVYVFNDDGYGIEIFVPKAAAIHPELLALCAQFAVPAPDVAQQ